MSAPSDKKIWVILGLAALLAGTLAGLALLSPKPPSLRATTLLKSPRPIADFKLTDQSGQPADKRFLMDRWTLVFAGFTSCPNICPTTLALLRQSTALLDETQRPRVVLLTVDPERDHPEQLKAYLAQFDPRFVGLTGDAESLRALRANLGLIAEKVDGASPGTYTVDHSASLVLINPKGEIAGYLSPPFDASAIAADLSQLSPST